MPSLLRTGGSKPLTLRDGAVRKAPTRAFSKQLLQECEKERERIKLMPRLSRFAKHRSAVVDKAIGILTKRGRRSHDEGEELLKLMGSLRL